VQPLLQCKSNQYYILCVYVYVCVCVCVCVCGALGTQHAELMWQSSVACVALQYFSTLSHERKDFRKRYIIKHKMCVLIFFTTVVWNISLLRRTEREIIKNVKYLLFLSDFNETWLVATDFRKIPKYQILWKSVQWESSCSMRADGQTGRPADGQT
jgi:hypothetical protein